MFLEAIAMEEPGPNRVIRAGYELLSRHTYFTAAVQDHRAWTVRVGATAPQSAAVIHTDFEKGLIRAEVVAYDDFIQYNGEAGAKEGGKWRMEFFFSSRRRHTMWTGDWSSDVCSSDLLDGSPANDLGVNTLRILGTNSADFFLLRANTTQHLGMVGAIQVDANKSPVRNGFFERVNYNEIGRASCRERG